MTIDFDRAVPLLGTHSAKWDAARIYGQTEREDLIPMWVADMDFPPPPSVTEALQGEIDRNVYGYWTDDAPVIEAISGWLGARHGWEIEADWVSFSSGVIHGLKMTLAGVTEPGDGVVLFTPVYHAFARTIRAMEREVVSEELVLEDGRYVMDLEGFRARLTGREKAVILCQPHNPGGRIWSAEEVRALGAICLEKGLILISDEIHMDLCFPGVAHLPVAVVAPETIPNLVVLTAASKGFNLAGGETAFMVVPDAALRSRVARGITLHGISKNRFGTVMLEAAFRGGQDWSDQVRAYIAGNFARFRDAVNKIPGAEVMEMEATYLSWVNFNGTGVSEAELRKRLVEDAGVVANAGPSFGPGGDGWARFNLATRTALVDEACARMVQAFGDLQ